ncbi:MAG: hypothetical protein A3I07_04005 [Candidatus Doudnabacteria bacterium RIFCSPLOWO2_02_FULL_42_9]|uniref:Uncharacterized protein n=1 Tax=Candidatus Doudnabacteria bacterium RIFCSPHIGHO2_01_FULL_41_86 TaxID=1817821 RepID=A0A1F5N8E8_9BACT|nr:MAG: hypothetical protein A2717_04495 [Candidatus Doudnabacteria bacterium RIFCSPHIGHO2_01_FULL_41_86]OGE75872.1 MAG: hypothetical protein A3K07_04090 [Candidatus Doudnabacteria bacterium RIFCSPHIGHO2_01_43_10]OGE86246.1 MAG: hypothetical protein A3E28_03850 [Candidatus Doudnabacteria bacterium RIFCSPHIGHO2_12_FULL_42_22]OGE87094.1 MAG: hypothetical protein A3C49_03515 [Candidatus Doudnabacteria bacterium RIFCSPHIGHO2_02_FULL_42_25]OGE92234.1 MAG: hypothetical protein A2895_04200 [Candidatus
MHKIVLVIDSAPLSEADKNLFESRGASFKRVYQIQTQSDFPKGTQLICVPKSHSDREYFRVRRLAAQAGITAHLTIHSNDLRETLRRVLVEKARTGSDPEISIEEAKRNILALKTDPGSLMDWVKHNLKPPFDLDEELKRLLPRTTKYFIDRNINREKLRSAIIEVLARSGVGSRRRKAS